jgi:hypothetical protein
MLCRVGPLVYMSSLLIREQALDSQWRVERRRKALGDAARLGELPRSHVQTLCSQYMFVKDILSQFTQRALPAEVICMVTRHYYS